MLEASGCLRQDFVLVLDHAPSLNLGSISRFHSVWGRTVISCGESDEQVWRGAGLCAEVGAAGSGPSQGDDVILASHIGHSLHSKTLMAGTIILDVQVWIVVAPTGLQHNQRDLSYWVISPLSDSLHSRLLMAGPIILNVQVFLVVAPTGLQHTQSNLSHWVISPLGNFVEDSLPCTGTVAAA